LPGVSIPDHLRERMRLAGDQGIQEGIRQSQGFLAEAQAYCDGTYLMPSFGRYEMVAELVKVLDRDRWTAERAAQPAATEAGQLLAP
jgi:homocysteine S-methyltransferase